MPKSRNSYRFSLGNSTVGVVGLCLTVEAATARGALRMVRKLLQDNDHVRITLGEATDVVLYLNGDSKELTDAAIESID